MAEDVPKLRPTRFVHKRLVPKGFPADRSAPVYLCPECDQQLLPESGCLYCPVCGWGRCG